MFLGFVALIAVLDIALCTDGSVQLEKRSPSVGFMGQHQLQQQQAGDKRAANSLGFSGMRDKKQSSDFSDEVADAEDLLELYDKRLGFNGMRGKKDDFGNNKRAAVNTLGFSGMRGKKDEEAEGRDELPDLGGADKRARSGGLLGFSGMRGKKLLLEDLYEEKRARNTPGFSGMRGKKDDDREEDDSSYALMPEDGVIAKRAGGANSLGFSGMRGKKEAGGAGLVEALQQPDYYDKRARSMSGFVGMRGRRDFWEAAAAADDSSDKRSPNGQAFVGMRGKRGDLEDAAALSYLLSAEAARDGVVTYRSKRFLPVNWPLRNSKKAPFSGFIGMRGKKSYFRPAPGSLSGNDNAVDMDQ